MEIPVINPTVLSISITLIIAVASLVTAFFQWKKAKEEANGFRQQLISILHHAEGVSNSLVSIRYPANDIPSYSSVNDVLRAIDGPLRNSQALFHGLLEIKVGGKKVRNDIDSKYSKYLDLELELKMQPLRDVLKTKKNTA